MSRYTVKAINAATKAQKFPMVIQRGYKGILGAYVQLRVNYHLNDRVGKGKYKPLVLDGDIGSHSVNNIILLQRMYGLVEDGKVGPQTLAFLRMGKAAAKKEAAKLRANKPKPPVVKPGKYSNVGPEAVDFMLKLVGKTERPRGSNVVPELVAIGKKLGWSAGIYRMHFPYCGYGVHAALESVSPNNPLKVSGTWGGYTGMYTPATKNKCEELVRAGVMVRVSFANARKGDIVLFDFQRDGIIDHIGFARGTVRNRLLPTVECNTSSGNSGSQANGDGIWKRDRPSSVIAAIYRFV